MSICRRVSTDIETLEPSTGGAVASATATSSGWGIVPKPVLPLQLDGSAHIAALVGILALALLGGILVARNRYDQPTALTTEAEPDREEFITDRERVRQLLQENDGRMKQSAIVDSVDWSKAKVSRLLADLEEDGQVTKLRLGRENLVCLPGHEPTASKSPKQPTDD
ncbi:helix-turn-helix transcriptional regulator [Natrinema caseinilyticum]|uniref:helix-turn-helix transcriptional regulator n=1 Tax=Natrinema caseinilyticum TaxID=2961570 RepID=UPI0020C4DFB3|nr:helix-turn-helix domain-containing protein [Natrinema caseinilyticum]